MTVLLDSYALIAYLRDEPAAAQVQKMLWDGEVAMSSVQLAEVIDRMERVYGVPADEVEVAVSALDIAVLPADYATGAEAGRIRARRYLPTGSALSLADAFCAATAVIGELTVATADPLLLAVTTAEGRRVLQLRTAT